MMRSANELAVAATTDSIMWIDSGQLSNLAGVSDRMARKAISRAADGMPWKGQHLIVRPIQGVGGNAGERFEINVESLPPELFAKWLAQINLPSTQTHFSGRIGLPSGPIQFDRKGEQHNKEAYWKWQLISPILDTPKHSKSRAELIAELAEMSHVGVDGEPVTVSYKTIYNWVAKYEQGGYQALMRNPRKDQGAKYVYITRRWDRECPFNEDVKRKIADKLAIHVRSLWAAGTPGWRNVVDLGSVELLDQSKVHGWQGVTFDCCKLSRAYVEQFRDFSVVAMHDKDAKQFFDVMTPRIRRHRDGIQPMDIVVGDVHPIDILMHRADGSIATPRAITWLDVATNRLHVTLILLEKGEGVKQMHVAQAFAAMCASWGMPRQLYLDNGSEYSWREMMDGFRQLSQLTQKSLEAHIVEGNSLLKAKGEVVRAKPYNAPAKPIEGVFSILEQYVLSMLPGWIGGNRMNKKTQNVGKEPVPYQGSWAEFHKSFDMALTYYHTKPQQGSRTLKGKSPNEALAEAMKDGWQGAPAVDYTALLLAFSVEDERQVHRGGYISWNGKTYFDDALIEQNGKRLAVRFSKWDDRCLFVFDATGKLLCAAQEAKSFPFFGSEGAQEQNRRNKIMKRHIRDLKANTVRLDLESEMQRRIDTAGTAIDAPLSGRIELAPHLQEMLNKMQEQQHRQMLEQMEERKEKKNRPEWSQWGNTANPLVDAVEFLDDGQASDEARP